MISKRHPRRQRKKHRNLPWRDQTWKEMEPAWRRTTQDSSVVFSIIGKKTFMISELNGSYVFVNVIKCNMTGIRTFMNGKLIVC